MTARLKQITIRDLVSSAIESGKDRESATDYVFMQINNDPHLFTTFAHDLIWTAISNEVRDICHKDRTAAWAQAMSGKSIQMSCASIRSAQRATSGEKKLLMDMQLSRGTLRNYTAPMLDGEAAMYEAQARTLSARAFFFRSVRMALKDDTVTVGNALDEQALQALIEKAEQ